MKYHKLPKRKNIGRGYVLHVKLVTPTELASITNESKALQRSKSKARLLNNSKQKQHAGAQRAPTSINRNRVVIGNNHVALWATASKNSSRNYMYKHIRRASAGAWVDTERTIYIDKSLTKQRQWEVYWHELLHAVLDIGTLDRGGI